jgi:protein phosphatase
VSVGSGAVLPIPDLALVILIAPSGSGKSTFARRHFHPTEIVSSDRCRALVSDDENDQSATRAAFEVLHTIVDKRLELGRLTVVDATNVRLEARQPLVALARKHFCTPVAIVFDLPKAIAHERNQVRSDRTLLPETIRRQHHEMRGSLHGLQREGFREVFVLTSPHDVDAAAIERHPLPTNRVDDHGPFDIVGDVHGCFDELEALLGRLGYSVTLEPDGATGPRYVARHPGGRRVIFLGDLVDRGPGITKVLRLAMDMVGDGAALCLPGNHDMKLLRKLNGRDVQISHGLAESLEQLAQEPATFVPRVRAFLESRVSNYLLDGGQLAVAHAGVKAEMQGRDSSRVRDFALFGETTGERDEYGLPVRLNWAAGYHGRATVVYGHTPVVRPEWQNNTINIDTGCVFGGALTALRYPEREIVSVPARRLYARSAKPFLETPQRSTVPRTLPQT